MAHRRLLSALLIGGAACTVITARGMAAGPGIDEVLGRVGRRVQEYYQRAQSVVATETVRLQPVAPATAQRLLVYDLRMAWEAAVSPADTPKANIVRQLLKVNGRTPRPTEPPGCTDPQSVSPEPLAMLLPERRGDNAFTLSGAAKIGGRAATVIEYKATGGGEAEVHWKDDCVSVSLPGRARGKIWIDVATDDVLRLDEQLVGRFEVPVPIDKVRNGVSSLVLERSESSIRYQAVVFRDPDETLMLPASIETLTIFRGSGVPILRTEQKFTNYRRFLGDSHLVTP